MHILFISDNFYPEMNAPAARLYEHAKIWVNLGSQVTIITCAPNFPDGKLLNGYKNKLWQEEIIDGIRVIRVWTFITKNTGIFLRTIDFLSFMVSSLIASFFIKKIDIVIGTSPQFFTACSARFASLFRKVPWIFELRDIWPKSIKAVQAIKQPLIIKMLEIIELALYKDASKIISVTHSFKQDLITRGIPEEKIKVITNGVDLSQFRPIKKNNKILSDLNLKSDDIIFGYIGTHGMAHSLETVIKAAAICEKKYKNIKFLLIGNGAKKEVLKKIAKKDKVKNIIFIDSKSRDEIHQYWSLLDFSIVHLKKNDIFKEVIPSKIFESMAMGIPIIHGVEGESSNLIKNHKVGLTFEPQNHEDLYQKIQKIISNQNMISEYKLNAIKTAKKFDRKILAKKMYLEIKKIYEKN